MAFVTEPQRLIPFPTALGSKGSWVLTGEVVWGAPEGKACRTCACDRLAGSRQAGALHQSCQAPKSFPRSRSETTTKRHVNDCSLNLNNIQTKPRVAKDVSKGAPCRWGEGKQIGPLLCQTASFSIKLNAWLPLTLQFQPTPWA